MKSERQRAAYYGVLLGILFSLGLLGISSPRHPGHNQGQRSPGAKTVDLSAINHVVFIVKENHTFDSYFGTFPGANGATSGPNSLGQVIPLGRMPDQITFDPTHSWFSFFTVLDGGKMDRFDLPPAAGPNGSAAYSQLTEQDIPNYFTYARHFVLADRMFSSFHGDSYPNHLYTIAAQSGGVIAGEGNVSTRSRDHSWGCDSPEGTTVLVKDPEGDFLDEFPCFDFQTLGDSLDSAGVSWNYYAPTRGNRGYNFSAYNSINHIRNTSLWTEHVVPETQFVTDGRMERCRP